MMYLHDNLRYLAKAKGIKMCELEREMDVSIGYISRNKPISLRAVYRASKILDVSIEDLIEKPLSKEFRMETIRAEIERLTMELEELENEQQAESNGAEEHNDI